MDLLIEHAKSWIPRYRFALCNERNETAKIGQRKKPSDFGYVNVETRRIAFGFTVFVVWDFFVTIRPQN